MDVRGIERAGALENDARVGPRGACSDLVGSNRGHATTDTDIRSWWPFEPTRKTPCLPRSAGRVDRRAKHQLHPGGNPTIAPPDQGRAR
jgi:hypothetical protein